MSTKNKKIIGAVVVGLVIIAGLLLVNRTNAASPAEFGLNEGNLIRATGDNDIFIVNEFGFKRLFLNPAIFNMYGHLGGWANVKMVSPATRDAFVTSPYYRVDGDTKVYKLAVTGDDTGTLSWVNMAQADFLAVASANQIFTINGNEFAWYAKGADVVAGNVSADVAVLSAGNLLGQTIPANASGVKVMTVDFQGNGAVNSLKLKRLGFQPSDKYDSIFLYKNGVRVTDPVEFGGTDNTVATFNNLGLTAPFTLDVVVNFNDAEVGSPAKVELQGDYNGLPLQSNQFLFANVASSAVTFANGANVADVIVGQVNAKVGEFKLSVESGDESVTVKSIQLRNVGTAEVSNVKIVVDGVTYQGVSLGDDKFLFATNFAINDGKLKKALVYADISTNSDDTEFVQFKLEKSYDITAVGNVYGFGVDVLGAGVALDVVDIFEGGSLVASTVTNKTVATLWGANGVQLFQFKLKATDESFLVEELGFDVHPSMSKVYVYDGATLVGSETVDGSIATVSTGFTLTGERTYTVKADFLAQGDTSSISFVPKLVAVNATGVGSDDEVSLSVNMVGKTVYVYPSIVSVSSSMTSGTFTPSVSKKVFAFDVTADGGEVKLASGSPLVVLSVETNGASVSIPWQLKSGSVVVASGSYDNDGSLEIGLDEQADDIVLSDGDSASFVLYFNTVNFTGTNRYVGVMLDNVIDAIHWFGQDGEGEWLSVDFDSVKDGIVGLPTATVELSE